ncbi:substrate-binding domain-containing protein [Leucobacter sp. gxy201]|uniref:LacI family DNA-binding transcriptional regulator n=1 Tax=Leucobacter sp. gxy201 TaxID=2957200 RepID=UPI003DA13CE7
MHTSRPITLKALASELGLNPSTVSRVLNDPAGPKSRWAAADTAERIISLAAERGYTRNPYAASLRTARSNLVGVIVPRLQDYVLSTIYEGIDEAATANGCLTMVSNSLDDAELRRTKTERLLASRVDGLVFGDARSDQRELFDELNERRVPHVLVSRRLTGHISVTCDDEAGGRMMAEHLVATGRTSFGILAGKLGTSTSELRTRGFVDALHEHGIDDDRITIVHGGFDAIAGRESSEQLLSAGPPPEAIFAANDFAAIGALGALTARGIHIHDDVAICGYNDTPLATSVGLTSVRSPMHRMGFRGYELLTEVLRGGTPDSERLAPELIVRGSTRAER